MQIAIMNQSYQSFVNFNFIFLLKSTWNFSKFNLVLRFKIDPNVSTHPYIYICPIIKIVRELYIFLALFFVAEVLLRIPTAVLPMAGTEGFKYQASEG